MMEAKRLEEALERQRGYFASGATLSPEARLSALERLESEVRRREGEMAAALYSDLGKSAEEAYMCETGLILGELSWLRRHLRGLMRERRAHTPLAQFRSRSFTRPSPLGSVLIMSPWNYPFLLTLEPLAGALAAGNTAVVKSSAYSPASSALLAGMIENCFDPRHVLAVTGGREANSALLDLRYDHIFFTGGGAVGREVLRRAAENLTPVTLELGGKSPCLVDSTADIELAARRIVYGKFINCGQTCVAPDYVYCDEAVESELAGALCTEIARQYPDALGDPTYGRMVSERHFERALGLIEPGKTACGGGSDAASLRIEPTVMRGVTFEDAVMREEIFGPVLPIVTYRSLEEAVARIEARPRPLALYLFTRSGENRELVLSRCRFGGGCVNDTVIHLATSGLPFGGVGESGMGAYHGRWSFETFSHIRGIVDKRARPDLPLRYRPFTRSTLPLLRRFMK